MNPFFIGFACLFAVLATIRLLNGMFTRQPLVLPKGWSDDLASSLYNYEIGRRPEPPPEPGEAQWEVVPCEDASELQNWLNDERFAGWSVENTFPQPNGEFTLILSRPLPAENE